MNLLVIMLIWRFYIKDIIFQNLFVRPGTLVRYALWVCGDCHVSSSCFGFGALHTQLPFCFVFKLLEVKKFNCSLSALKSTKLSITRDKILINSLCKKTNWWSISSIPQKCHPLLFSNLTDMKYLKAQYIDKMKTDQYSRILKKEYLQAQPRKNKRWGNYILNNPQPNSPY